MNANVIYFLRTGVGMRIITIFLIKAALSFTKATAARSFCENGLLLIVHVLRTLRVWG